MLMPNAPEQSRQAHNHYGGGGTTAARSPFNHMTSFLSRQHQISVSNTHDLRRRQVLTREEDPLRQRKSSRSGTRNGSKKP